jgi:hypothetical protein
MNKITWVILYPHEEDLDEAKRLALVNSPEGCHHHYYGRHIECDEHGNPLKDKDASC